MIIEKQPLPNDPTPSDAPPSYDALLVPIPSPSSSYPPDSKASTSSIASPPLSEPQRSSKPPTPSSLKPKGPSSWFSFSTSRTAREVRTTVLGLIRDLVRHNPSSAFKGILDSCAEACTAHGLIFSEILQEKSIEGKTPIYWAIIKRPPEDARILDDGDTGPDLVTSILQLSSPLTSKTISDIRLACLVTSDQPLFQRLRLSPAFAPIKGTDDMLLGENELPPDSIEVEDVKGDDEGAFVVKLGIGMFQKRMRVGGGVGVEFIARGRLFSLSFSIAPPSHQKPGSWLITLALLEHSPPTWIDSRLIIDEPPAPLHSTSLIDTYPPKSRSKSKPKPSISLRLKSGYEKLVAPRVEEGKEWKSSWEKEQEMRRDRIVVGLDDSLMGGSLMYAGSSYIDASGTLTARLEARLAKTDTDAECIIC